MPDLRRLFVEPGDLSGESALIRDAEAHHALHVLRMKPGDRVSLFDGAGLDAAGVVTDISRKEVTVAIGERHDAPPPPFELVLLQAWIHRDKALEDLIRRGTEIGINRFVFFAAQRSERQPKLSDKWRRWAIDACKQCGRPWLPEFVCTARLGDALTHAKGALCLLTLHEPEPKPLCAVLDGRGVTLLAGPEGDFTPEEEAAAREAGAVPISLGPVVFRAEVAAITAATLVQYEHGALGPRPS